MGLCSNCKSLVDENLVFCPQCGQMVKSIKNIKENVGAGANFNNSKSNDGFYNNRDLVYSKDNLGTKQINNSIEIYSKEYSSESKIHYGFITWRRWNMIGNYYVLEHHSWDGEPFYNFIPVGFCNFYKLDKDTNNNKILKLDFKCCFNNTIRHNVNNGYMGNEIIHYIVSYYMGESSIFVEEAYINGEKYNIYKGNVKYSGGYTLSPDDSDDHYEDVPIDGYEGFGTIYNESGQVIYEGEWRERKKNGLGKVFYAQDGKNTLKYKGALYEDYNGNIYAHGFGELFNIKGEPIYKGEFNSYILNRYDGVRAFNDNPAAGERCYIPYIDEI
ncbi:MAG TPA: hypothetical protein VEB00_01430 [Clostridia bacterium]|nr:hypothetical protein [Clostridia bacterium]